ncbi:Coenzyme F420 hydrogenase/dehydrogenase, beta subunit C-terminal domain [uncultured Draconibacterium sp.]|uniref:Coenzyme F420 hydrogenase/dehydrogenase, beta subunit C-terminal domain n=1 Tax=uncultured Draconibacterium sp. TaxID=1573823 RepID=UPI002AA75803|nr:Coenzyme F420 hydrogenase/dehydrogenase, beta subunit C-terminal domain [uncultured Draconibacterium sp.]
MPQDKSDISKLFNTVVNGDYCIGCGACATPENSPITIEFDSDFKLKASLPKRNKQSYTTSYSVLKVCPFSNETINEDEIGQKLFGAENKKVDKLGYITSTFAGYTFNQKLRENGSSGGMVSWILLELHKQGIIDYVAHVQKSDISDKNNRLFQYKISSTQEEIKNGAKSRYYPVELSEVIKHIKEKEGKYAIVGLPCFIKAVRLLMIQDQILAQRIKFCIGLVCGHLKSANFANMWSWQVGIHPENLHSIDFRTKLENYGADQYGITAIGAIDSKLVERTSPPLKNLFGGNWGWGLFKYNACDYCDDVVAETADITIGDAWLPRYVKDSQGTNIIIVRNKKLLSVLELGQETNHIKLDSISKDEIIESQSSGFFHRREGLAYRLYLKEKQNEWYPFKRIEASENAVSKKIRKRQLLRLEISQASHAAFKKALKDNSFQSFVEHLHPLIEEYQKLYKPSLMKQLKKKLKKILIK